MVFDSAHKGGIGSIMANTTRKAYDKETFAALVECCSRLFCCDEEIVITDLLLAVEKAITERDIEAEIGLPERKVNEHLARLERHGLVTKVTTGQASDILAKPIRQPKSAKDILPPQQTPSTTQSYWRLSKYFIIVVHYKLTKMEEMLQQRRRSLHDCDRFVCHTCNAIYDSLDVQKLEMDGFDAHFICYCGSKVELDDTATKDSIYSSQQQRCEEQVKTLKKCLAAAWGMELPLFPIYVKNKDKGDKAQEDTEGLSSAQSNVGGASSVVSNGSGTSDASSVNTPRPLVKSLLSDINKHTKGTLGKKSETGKIKFRMSGTFGQKQSTTETTAASKLLEQPKEAAVVEAPRDKGAQTDAVDTSPGEAEPGAEDITFYITKLGKAFPLTEAQNHQQHMSNQEFENFLELQDRYLNFL
ncbi:general transcription factor IIE polypeptide 1 [Babesia ovis]|uniref:General transcription factor IIE polypeptide 1 n=1 Tax=Babesia ovis TaxID=5869 RepID=A0A9W5TEE4_BABOV|nr:general transcription factor IIE polypeptide 1 [Babesia ovis]